jgi:hypothetical protein
MNEWMYVLPRVGYVTRRISSLCQECSDYLLRIRFYAYTILHIKITLNLNPMSQFLFNYISANAGLQLSSVATIPRLSFECNPLLYIRSLPRNEPFVITVDTPVRITTELLLFPRQRFRRFHRSVSSGFQACTSILKLWTFASLYSYFRRIMKSYLIIN